MSGLVIVSKQEVSHCYLLVTQFHPTATGEGNENQVADTHTHSTLQSRQSNVVGKTVMFEEEREAKGRREERLRTKEEREGKAARRLLLIQSHDSLSLHHQLFSRDTMTFCYYFCVSVLFTL